MKSNRIKGSSDPAQQTQVYARVQVLLNGHDDLLDEFRKPLFQIRSFSLLVFYTKSGNGDELGYYMDHLLNITLVYSLLP